MKRTVRLRLTALYVGLFLASGACLLVITYLLVAQQLPGTLSVRSITGGGTGDGTSPEVVTGGTAGTSAITACVPSPDGTPPSGAQVTACSKAAQAEAAGLRRDTLDQLLIESGVAFGIMAVASVGLGWLVAGRVLRPLRTITAAARRISARSLHQRIAMTGPDDELKELGDTFDQLLGRLDASFRAQRQFVANASHELRTPLARQRTLLEVALRGRPATNASLRLACERALVAGEQQERLITALLTLARGERGLDAFEPFDLGAVAAETLAARRDEAQARGVTVTADLGPAPALGDPRLAERLAANLADNAIRYNVPGGLVEITSGQRDGQAFLAVTNTGPVIPPDQLGRLFQPFQRLAPSRIAEGRRVEWGRTEPFGTERGPAEPGGLGLGLAIVSAIAAAHGAALHAVTRAAGGLTVEVVFPPRRADRITQQQTGDRSVVPA
jgi:signal transduction histidine kinase